MTVAATRAVVNFRRAGSATPSADLVCPVALMPTSRSQREKSRARTFTGSDLKQREGRFGRAEEYLCACAKSGRRPRSLLRHHARLQRADAVDLDADDVAFLEEVGRLGGEADAAGRAGEDHVARHQRHRLAEQRDLVEDVEDKIARVRVLPRLAVD